MSLLIGTGCLATNMGEIIEIFGSEKDWCAKRGTIEFAQ